MWQKKGWLGDLHLPTFGALTSTAMCLNRWYSLQNSTQPAADIPASYLLHDWIESQTWYSATGLFQNWTWARLMDGQRATKTPGISMRLFWNKKKKRRGIGKFLLVFSNAPEDGGECLSGHCAHRKQGTVGVLSSSIVSFHWGLEGIQPPEHFGQQQAGEKSCCLFFCVCGGSLGFLADTLWIMIYDKPAWVSSTHTYFLK